MLCGGCLHWSTYHHRLLGCSSCFRWTSCWFLPVVCINMLVFCLDAFILMAFSFVRCLECAVTCVCLFYPTDRVVFNDIIILLAQFIIFTYSSLFCGKPALKNAINNISFTCHCPPSPGILYLHGRFIVPAGTSDVRKCSLSNVVHCITIGRQ